MIYNGTPINSMKVKHYEMSTADATLKASDMQAGVTAYAKGKKVTGTGKCFSFAMYGNCASNISFPIPVSVINTINISSDNNNVKLAGKMFDFRNFDFTTSQTIATISVDGIDYDIRFKVENNFITISCDKNVTLQVMFGKDDHI